MKNYRKSLGGMLVAAVVAVMALFTSCKQESADVSSLLATVPSSSGMVVGVNLKTVLEKTGCKVDGSSITPGKEVQEWLDGLTASGSNAELLRLFLNGESGIDPLGLVVFSDAYNVYATAMLADTDKFFAFVEKQTGTPFSEAEGGVKTSGNIAVNGAQMWVCCTSATTVDARAIKNYASLSGNQSFMSKNVSEPIAEMKTDIAAWGDINTLAKNNLSVGNMAMVNTGVGALFEDPTSVAFTVNCEKGVMKAHLNVLNDKGNNAKFLLPTKKIDTDLVSGLASTADVVAAAGISKDLTKKVEQMVSTFGGHLFDEYVKIVKQLDGTTAVALGVKENGSTPIAGIAQTDGAPDADIMNFLSQYGGVKKEEKSVLLNDGTVSGTLNVKECSDVMKGSWIALASSLENRDAGLKSGVFTIKPAGNSIEFDAQLKAKDEKKSILLTLLKYFSGSKS